jgi:hypothetical protein
MGIVWIAGGLFTVIAGVMLAVTGFRQGAIRHRAQQRLESQDRYADAAGAATIGGAYSALGAVGIILGAGGLIMIINGLLEL